MAGQGVTVYLIILIAISTLGSLQFGFHLVRVVCPLLFNASHSPLALHVSNNR